MDLQGKAENFPEPGDVLVTASQLSVQEKALMLYRHAKAVGLEPVAKEIVKQNVRHIIADPNFTPERIRRFTRESLPVIASPLQAGTPISDVVKEGIREAIRNPTNKDG